MKASRRVFQCEQCGAQQPKWTGQCPDCQAWNSLIETVQTAAPTPSRHGSYSGEAPRILALSEVDPTEAPRLATGLSEFDRVLGGGLVEGSVVLIGGDPGIGKSTLLLQSLAHMAGPLGQRVLYVSGEESSSQIALRAERLRLPTEKLRLLTETCIERVLALAERERPRVMVIDSIQTLFTESLQSAPGSVAQVRECAAQLVRFAKATRVAIHLVGHVTKDGALAGPRVLEHMVDAVLYFEGETGGRYRLVRAFKNRFGAVNELGVFAMTDGGLREVTNPSAMLLSRHERPVAGSVVMVTREGTRPLLVEVQALVDPGAAGNPRRVTVGLEQNRLSMLLAVLNRHGGVATAGCDVFVNIVGGVRLTETAGDLAVVTAVLSSLRDRPPPEGLVVFGELGLAGEVRPVQGGPERLREAAKHGFKRAIVPRGNVPKGLGGDLEVTAVTRLAEALGEL